MPPFLPLFRSEAQLRILGLLVFEPKRERTIDELATAVDAPRPSVHRELQRAVAAGLIERDGSRRPHSFRAVPTSPLYGPLRSLLESTVGVEAELRAYFAERQDVDSAVIFGSWARGEARVGSDIDLLVIGTPALHDLKRDIRAIGRRAGRTIDLVVFSRPEYDGRLANGDGFVRKVLREPQVVLVGDPDGLTP